LPEGAKVRLDFMLLKAAVDAASPERIEAAQQVAVDPAAPRRALVQAREDEVSPPMDYLGESRTCHHASCGVIRKQFGHGSRSVPAGHR
jgi:hypothetical protein